MQRSYQYGGEYKEYHLVGSTVIALIFKSGDGSGKSRPLGQSLSRTWSNEKSSLTIKPSGCLPVTQSVSLYFKLKLSRQAVYFRFSKTSTW